MKARTLKIGEKVCIALDGNAYIGMGDIVAIDGKRKDFHLSGDEHDVDVEITLTDISVNNNDDRVGDNIHVNNNEVYQIVPYKTFGGCVACYEFDEDMACEYYCPELDTCFDEEDFDETPFYRCKNGHDYVQKQIDSGRWDLDSDTFNIKEALADAWNEGFAQGKGEYSIGGERYGDER